MKLDGVALLITDPSATSSNNFHTNKISSSKGLRVVSF